MPQINRVRVNNVKYNFGTQVYDDFMMRFNGKNTIYDLANGGGKSLLMLLLMQNMIPNCTLDDKQPIEKLFRQGGGNTCIHSLVEWKLDSCYQKDGFKYMTTGFCARKGRNGAEDEEELEQLADNGMNSASSANSSGSASVEYYNYCIFYKEYGDNDIKNLPLVKDKERVTYNGLKAYLRELEKDYHYVVKIFERKGDYQSFISNYGIYESAWEIVRGINKTEGHVRTYFETNYKTSRKVVEDLLIEEIIQKSFNNRLSVDNDEGKMAKTLMDIKDKLMELSKKHAQIGGFDSQIAAIEGFKEYLQTYEEFYTRKENAKKQLFDLLVEAIKVCANKEALLEEKNKLIDKIVSETAKEREAIAVAEVILQKVSYASVDGLVKETELDKQKKEQAIEELSKKLSLMEAASDYKDYKDYEKSYNELSIALESRLLGDEEILNQLRQLAATFKQIYDRELKALTDNREIAKNNLSQCEYQSDEAKAALRNADKDLAELGGLKAHLESIIDKASKEMKVLLEDADLLVAENSGTELREMQIKLADITKERAELAKEAEALKGVVISKNEAASASRALVSILSKEIEELKENEGFSEDNQEKIESIKNIYNGSNNTDLLEIIHDTYNQMFKEYNSLNAQILEIEQFVVNARAGEYICKDATRQKLKEYLVGQYGEDVVEGHSWFESLPVGQRRDVLKRTPFIEYGFIIKNDFERIKQDEILINFGRSGCIYPVISEQVLIDTKLEINKDLIVFAMKDMSFLREDARLEAELKRAEDELDNLRMNAEKLKDRMDFVWGDYIYVVEYEAAYKNVDISKTINELQCKIVIEEDNISECQQELKVLDEEQKNLTLRLESCQDRYEKANSRVAALEKVYNKYIFISDNYKQLKEVEAKLEPAKNNIEACEAACNKALREYESVVSFVADLDGRIKNLKKLWDNEYSEYYKESEGNLANVAESAVNKNEIESKFLGLKTALTDKNGDIADKQALMNHFRLSMEKCVSAIEYKGYSLEEIKAQVEKGSLGLQENTRLVEVKREVENAKANLKTVQTELESQSALLNRLDGSIAHGIHQIEERYGEYREFSCDNPESFMEQHKGLVKKLEANIKQQELEKDKLLNEVKEIAIVKKDLERIVSDAGMELPKDYDNLPESERGIRLSEYEAVSKDYNGILKLEYKKVDEFAKNKQKLIDLLKGFDATALADEIKVSLNLPENADKTRALMKSLEETNTFIELERDRVSKGIQDMERIKDNFENRCIQTCSNIKTELDRLPQLSNINLDGEQISIISLSIPYIKEELYKDRMSQYIDETVVMAESFKDSEERLKYIRNRLTWKRLFSVIVTDMNSIRLNLYKRERIKDQSRFLRYEEAVGSTGQSQGIYIQFLISIINYISNMNSKNADGSVEGKTIFIDNPFGAAKDIYIWEPIFKLLVTNHVQLIVPARGATPAITGRFDVNYILGQQLVDKRQQTVVVDYYSNTKEAELEYTRMDYEQASFDFL